MMTFIQLFLRDGVYHRKTFAALSATVCLVCAILTAAMLIGDSVRGTLYDNLNRNTAFVQTCVRFPAPVNTTLPGAVLHTRGFIAPGIKTHLYAFADAPVLRPDNTVKITGRDAYCSAALAEALNLSDGDLFTVRVLTVASIPSENVMGQPPTLRQLQLAYRGVWPGLQANVNFESPQLRENNLFVNHAFLARSLELDANAVNEVWLPTREETPALPDEVIWKLAQLEFDRWDDRPVLKSKAFFLPPQIPDLFPEAAKGLVTFVESFSGEQSPDDNQSLHYLFVGAFEGDIFPVEENRAILSDVLEEDFPHGGTLTYFTSDAFRRIERNTHAFSQVTKSSDAHITAVLSPEVPGLTDMTDCTEWVTGMPIDLNHVSETDKAYWEQHKSKPKLYLNFAQAQELFGGHGQREHDDPQPVALPQTQCTVLIFDRHADTSEIQAKIIAALRRDASPYQVDHVVESLRANIAGGLHFTPLFLGLSCFIIVSALLVLAMLLKLHLFDRAEEFRVIADHTTGGRKFAIFHLAEIVLILLPGMVMGLLCGVPLCHVQLFLLERVWNGIILMNRLNFHAQPTTFLIAFAATGCCAVIVLTYSLRSKQTSVFGRFFSDSAGHYYIKRSYPIRSAFSLGTRSFFRRFGQYRMCMALLTLGFLGTIGVGAFGIKNRGEDAFSHGYIAETALPVVPLHDEPFPPGGIAVRVKYADSADCSNILRADTPTVYGCDTAQLNSKLNQPGANPRANLSHGCAAVDAGSLQWIMKKRLGDTIVYPNGSVTLQRTMKASVFQRGILVSRATFEELFPEVQGAQFFLIRTREDAEVWQKYLEPFGVTLVAADEFMAMAESFQNRYLMIFLQLGTLGFVLGIGSLMLLMLRNLRAQRKEINFLSDLGLSRNTLFWAYCVENLWLYLSGALLSLAILCLLALVAELHPAILFTGWTLLTALGVTLIFCTLRVFFQTAFFK
ncbi:MAG: hypothetical protein FWD31_09755 [Planctomycetaceae bacterium]|nr:hypothetical protein [Planctomycetaceae bacterium]